MRGRSERGQFPIMGRSGRGGQLPTTALSLSSASARSTSIPAVWTAKLCLSRAGLHGEKDPDRTWESWDPAQSQSCFPLKSPSEPTAPLALDLRASWLQQAAHGFCRIPSRGCPGPPRCRALPGGVWFVAKRGWSPSLLQVPSNPRWVGGSDAASPCSPSVVFTSFCDQGCDHVATHPVPHAAGPDPGPF